MSAVDTLVDLIIKTSGTKEKTYPYETEAVVQRVEDGIAYVKIGEAYETPADMSISASPGEKVKVRVANNRAYIIGNNTEPPTGDYKANIAINNAKIAHTTAIAAGENAAEAANTAATAQESANTAASAASVAQISADSAVKDAARAYEAAEDATASAESARGLALDAKVSAYKAQQSANTANKAANNAITQLSTVESVVNTLAWLTEHSTPTEDTSVVPGKNYFIKYEDGTFSKVVDPMGDPQAQGWYEMDEAVSNYVAAHLALTDYGLNLVLDNSSYRIHIGTYTANGKDGVYVIDGNGNVVTYFGDSITFDDEHPFHIGSEDSYILFNPVTNQITIGGDVVFGSKPLSQMLAEIADTMSSADYISKKVTKIQKQIENGDASSLVLNIATDYSDARYVTLTAELYRGPKEVTHDYPETMFYWYEKSEDGVKPFIGIDPETGEDTIGGEPLGYSKIYDRENAGFGTTIVCQLMVGEDIFLITPDNYVVATPDGKALYTVVE